MWFSPRMGSVWYSGHGRFGASTEMGLFREFSTWGFHPSLEAPRLAQAGLPGP